MEGWNWSERSTGLKHCPICNSILKCREVAGVEGRLECLKRNCPIIWIKLGKKGVRIAVDAIMWRGEHQMEIWEFERELEKVVQT